jgi:hypothetical protein
MSIQDIDRSALKVVITEILLENPKYFKELIKELLVENQIIITEEQADRRKRLERMIDEDFDKYDEVFKSLA